MQCSAVATFDMFISAKSSITSSCFCYFCGFVINDRAVQFLSSDIFLTKNLFVLKPICLYCKNSFLHNIFTRNMLYDNCQIRFKDFYIHFCQKQMSGAHPENTKLIMYYDCQFYGTIITIIDIQTVFYHNISYHYLLIVQYM